MVTGNFSNPYISWLLTAAAAGAGAGDRARAELNIDMETVFGDHPIRWTICGGPCGAADTSPPPASALGLTNPVPRSAGVLVQQYS